MIWIRFIYKALNLLFNVSFFFVALGYEYFNLLSAAYFKFQGLIGFCSNNQYREEYREVLKYSRKKTLLTRDSIVKGIRNQGYQVFPFASGLLFCI